MEREGALRHAPSAADPEDAGRQALRQGPGHHRAAARRRQLHRRHPARRAEAMSLRAVLARLALLALPLTAAAEAAALAIVIRDRAALRAAPRDCGAGERAVMAGRDARGPRRAPRLPPGLRLQARARRIRAGERGPAHLPWARGSARAPLDRALPAATCRARKRWASASPRPTSRRRRRKCWRARSESRRSTRWGASPSASPSARRRAPRRTGPHRRSSRAHLDVAARYGVGFAHYERNGRAHYCYEGEAYRRVLAMRSSRLSARAPRSRSPAPNARAPGCVPRSAGA